MDLTQKEWTHACIYLVEVSFTVMYIRSEMLLERARIESLLSGLVGKLCTFPCKAYIHTVLP